MPFFSVIIPLYNKEFQISKTLNSVLSQDFIDFEVIIVDDGSTDNGPQIVKTFKDKRIHFFHQKNGGAGAARNFGISKASANHIALLDADDLWMPNHLSSFKESLKKYPKQVWFSNAYSVKHSDKLIVKGVFKINYGNKINRIEDYFKASYVHPLVWTSCVMFKKDTFKLLRGFNASILSGQDLDLWIRFALNHDLIFNRTYTSIYDKTIAHSLSKENHQEAKYQLFKSYDSQAKTNKSLKRYLNFNNYSLAIQCKLVGNKKTYSKLRNDIDPNLLNGKQRFLLNQPFYLTKAFKKLYKFLVKHNIYLTAYK